MSIHSRESDGSSRVELNGKASVGIRKDAPKQKANSEIIAIEPAIEVNFIFLLNYLLRFLFVHVLKC